MGFPAFALTTTTTTYKEEMMSAQRYKVPSTNALVSRILLELLALCLLGYPMLHIYVFLQGDAEPYERGFYCDGKIFILREPTFDALTSSKRQKWPKKFIECPKSCYIFSFPVVSENDESMKTKLHGGT